MQIKKLFPPGGPPPGGPPAGGPPGPPGAPPLKFRFAEKAVKKEKNLPLLP